MSREFNFIDLYYLNDLSDSTHKSSEISLDADTNFMKSTMDVIRISDIEKGESDLTYTYAKFLEILDTQGLDGLVNT